MIINSIKNAVELSDKISRVFNQWSATGFFADNTLAKKFVNANTVIIPNTNIQCLANYDCKSDFSRGAISLRKTPHTLSIECSRSFFIDSEQINILSLASEIISDYVRTRVIPECDAYIVSKLAGLAASRGNIIKCDINMLFDALCNLVDNVQNVVGFDEEFVAFLDNRIYAAFQNSSEVSQIITESNFKQGDAILQVKSINGVALIPVDSEIMKTSYVFNNNIGGFKPGKNAREIYMLVCPKNAAHLVKKIEPIEIFTPKQSRKYDAYRFDCRIFYDVFIGKSKLDSVWACIS